MKWIQAAMVCGLMAFSQLSVMADQSTVDYDTQTGYIRTVRPAQVQQQEQVASQAGRQRAAAAPAAPVVQTPGTLTITHSTGQSPDPVRQKVDLRTMTLVANDQIHPSADVLVLRAGSGETTSVSIMKCSADSVCMIGDTSPLWVGLVPVVDGSPALPGTQNGGTPPHGRILSMPRGIQAGHCTVVIKASDQTGEDMLVITQPGLEPMFVQVKYE